MGEEDQGQTENKDQAGTGNNENDNLLASSNENHEVSPPLPVYKQGVRDNSDDSKFLFCFPMKCAVISIGIYIILNLLFNCY